MVTLRDVIEHFDGIPELAMKLGIKPQAIYQWGSYIPPEQAIEIERLSAGRFKAVDLPVRRRKAAAP